jgi:hypothetical protein
MTSALAALYPQDYHGHMQQLGRLQFLEQLTQGDDGYQNTREESQ